MPVMDFLAVRFSVAAFFMLVMRPSCLRGMNRTGFVGDFLFKLGYLT
jgi:hypothetical protein